MTDHVFILQERIHRSRGCPPPVDYRSEYDTTFLDNESVNTGSGRLLADWYSVIVTFSDYLVSLETRPLLYSADNATMQTLDHILTAVKQDFLGTVSNTNTAARINH